MNIPAPPVEYDLEPSYYKTGCEHNLIELAFSLMLFTRLLHGGEFPEDLEDLYYDDDLRDILKGDTSTESFFCPLPIDGKRQLYLYHKPPPDASDDFIVLECPNHPDFKVPLSAITNKFPHRRPAG